MIKVTLPVGLSDLLLRAADQAYPNSREDGSPDPMHTARLSKLREGAEIAHEFLRAENEKLRRIVRNANDGLKLFAEENGDEDDEYKDWFEDAKEFLAGAVHPDEACTPPTDCTNEICRMQRSIADSVREELNSSFVGQPKKFRCCTCDGCCDPRYGLGCLHQYCVEHTI